MRASAYAITLSNVVYPISINLEAQEGEPVEDTMVALDRFAFYHCIDDRGARQAGDVTRKVALTGSTFEIHLLCGPWT